MKRKKSLLMLLMAMMLILSTSICVQAATASSAKPAQVKKIKVKNSGTSKHVVTWKKMSGVDGYQLYCKVDKKDKCYKKVKNLKGKSKNTYTVKNRKRGVKYYYIVRAYKKVNGKTVVGKFSAIATGYIKPKKAAATPTPTPTATPTPTPTPAPVTTVNSPIMNPTVSQKYKLVFGDSKLRMDFPGGYYTSDAKAKPNMKTITVKTWDFATGKSGIKITRTWYLTVHKNLASTVQQIFKEIYEGKEKFPIHELGGYAWRGGHSEHNTGTAIDINWTENYMIQQVNGKTQIVAGSFWKPGVDPYSIPKAGEVAKIFNKYGFTQGDWGTSKDYMHFSYFGT